MGGQVVTVTKAEEAATEEAACEAIVDEAFVPSAPITTEPATYAAGTTYAKGDLVKEGSQVYRSQQAANKGHEPKGDTDFEWWAPIGTSVVRLQNPSFGGTPAIVSQRGYAQKPPASSAATAHASETVEPGEEVPVTG